MRLSMDSDGMSDAAQKWRGVGDDVGGVQIDAQASLDTYGSAVLAAAAATFASRSVLAADVLQSACHDTATAIDGVRDSFNSMEQTFARAIGAVADEL